MDKLLYKICLLQLLVMGCHGKPIEELFPKAKSIPPGIKVQVTEVAGMDCYQILEFPEEEKNRNHYQEGRTEPVDHLVMHYTHSNFERTMYHFTRDVTDGRVSAHYVITEKEEEQEIQGGVLFQVVPEEKIAWHAGISYWRGTTNLNPRSIGIENVNRGFEGEESSYPTWFKFDQPQISALGRLSQDIVTRHGILPQNVVGHADIASGPRRKPGMKKQDPGILFPWEELHTQYGVGAWLTENEQSERAIQAFVPKEPLPQGISEAFFLSYLQTYGYDCPDIRCINKENAYVVKAFKAHFSHNQQPESYDATIDRKAILWIWGLVAKYK